MSDTINTYMKYRSRKNRLNARKNKKIFHVTSLCAIVLATSLAINPPDVAHGFIRMFKDCGRWIYQGKKYVNRWFYPEENQNVYK